MIVTISLRAEADIQEIGAYIAQDSPRAGAHMSDTLFDACAELLPFPERFALATELDRPGVRRRAVGDYLIFYIVRPTDVFVLRVAHGARDYPKLFLD